MNETISKEQFAEKVLQYVREALPEELAGVKIRSASVDLWDGGSRTVLLVIRPWTDIIQGVLRRKKDSRERCRSHYQRQQALPYAAGGRPGYGWLRSLNSLILCAIICYQSFCG